MRFVQNAPAATGALQSKLNRQNQNAGSPKKGWPRPLLDAYASEGAAAMTIFTVVPSLQGGRSTVNTAHAETARSESKNLFLGFPLLCRLLLRDLLGFLLCSFWHE